MGVLLLAAIESNGVGILALVLFALCTAISMTAASTLFGHALGRRAVRRRFAVLAPGLALVSFAFGAWYALGAIETVPYFL
ncbi:MAG: hypothetical protein M3N16_00325 [Actinomycetota bacterium]|nr:hypothetical protein [Actinomycetota bacterium]